MSAATTTVDAAPSSYTGSVVLHADAPPPDNDGTSPPSQSFNEVLSEQSGGDPTQTSDVPDVPDVPDVHARDACDRKDPASGEKPRSPRGNRPSWRPAGSVETASSPVTPDPKVIESVDVGLSDAGIADGVPGPALEDQTSSDASASVRPHAPPTSAVDLPAIGALSGNSTTAVRTVGAGADVAPQSSHESGVDGSSVTAPAAGDAVSDEGANAAVDALHARPSPEQARGAAGNASTLGIAPSAKSAALHAVPGTPGAPGTAGSGADAASRAASLGAASTPGDPAPGSSPLASSHPQIAQDAPASNEVHPAGEVLKAAGFSALPSPSADAQASAALDVEGLSTAISRPLGNGNGNYTVTIAMHPPELGRVQAVISLDGSDLQVSIAAQTQRGHEALLSSVDALKGQLARGGVNVNVSLRDPGSQTGGDTPRPPAASGAGTDGTEEHETAASLPSTLTSGQIHLVL